MSKPPKDGIVIKENIVIDERNSSFEHPNKEIPHLNIISVMVTNVDTSEDRIVELEKQVNMLIKTVEERGLRD